MRRKSNRARKKRVISDLGSPLRSKATGTRHVARKRPILPHGNKPGEREIRAIARERCSYLQTHVEVQDSKVFSIFFSHFTGSYICMNYFQYILFVNVVD